MTFQDYVEEVRGDAERWLEENRKYYGDFECAWECMVDDDSVTGNGSGSYTFNSAKAAENVADLFWDDEFLYELRNLGWTVDQVVDRGPEDMDVIARYLAVYRSQEELAELWDERRRSE